MTLAQLIHLIKVALANGADPVAVAQAFGVSLADVLKIRESMR